MPTVAVHGLRNGRMRHVAASLFVGLFLCTRMSNGAEAPPLAQPSEPRRSTSDAQRLLHAGDSLLARFRAGPMAGVDEFIFCARKPNEADWHWYANIGYYADDADRKAWREGAKLYRWNVVTGKLTTLLADPARRHSRSPGSLRRKEDPLQLPQRRDRELPALRDQHATAPACANSPTAPTTTSSPPTCPTGRSSSSRRAPSAGSIAGSPRWPCCIAAMRTAGTSAPSPATTSRTTPPGRFPMAASSTPAGNTWTAARSITTICGRPTPTAPARWSGTATSIPAPS